MMLRRNLTMMTAASLALAAVACSSSSATTGGTGGSTSASSSAGGASSSSMSSTSMSSSSSTGSGGAPEVPTVFLILMENHNWSEIKGSKSAPYINSLLAQGASCEDYYNPKSLHPSEPNYIWLEAGDNMGVFNDASPSTNHFGTDKHLVNQIEAIGLDWRSYQEDIEGNVCPLSSVMKYAPKHNPMVFFDDVTNTNDPMSARCIKHVRPYTELATDLMADKVAAYNFLTPNLCNDMHDNCAGDAIKQGDDWLSKEVPKIQASAAYGRNGVIIITWDEGEGSDGPIGLIVLSQYAKTGYSDTSAMQYKYTHSSTLLTVQEMMKVGPPLGDAAKATDLAALFTNGIP